MNRLTAALCYALLATACGSPSNKNPNAGQVHVSAKPHASQGLPTTTPPVCATITVQPYSLTAGTMSLERTGHPVCVTTKNATGGVDLNGVTTQADIAPATGMVSITGIFLDRTTAHTTGQMIITGVDASGAPNYSVLVYNGTAFVMGAPSALPSPADQAARGFYLPAHGLCL